MSAGLDLATSLVLGALALVALSGPASARRNRLVSLALAFGLVMLGRVIAPGLEERSVLTHRFVFTLGYGHLLGAALPRRRSRPPAGSRWGRAALLGLPLVLVLFAVYSEAVARWSFLVWALLVISVWHTVENDWQLRAAYAGSQQLSKLSRRLTDHAEIVAWASLLLLAAERSLSISERRAALPSGVAEEAFLWLGASVVIVASLLGSWGAGGRLARGRGGALALVGASLAICAPGRWPPFVDVFAAMTLYHLISFLILTADRIGSGADRRLALPRLVLVHGVPALVFAVDAFLPGTSLRWLFSPAPYLFFSVLHVLHTVVRREVRGPSARGDRGRGGNGPCTGRESDSDTREPRLAGGTPVAPSSNLASPSNPGD